MIESAPGVARDVAAAVVDVVAVLFVVWIVVAEASMSRRLGRD
jgi:hypothetical protein